MEFRTRVGWWAALAFGAVPVALAPLDAAGQGFGLNEIGSCAIGRGFATTGAPCDDASVLYWNPAAATRLSQGLQAYAGVSAIQVLGSFTQDVTRREFEGDVPIEFPPFLGVSWKGSGPTTSRLALGVAAYVPYGLTSQWGEDFIGRFSAQKASLQTIYVQPTVAFDLVPGRVSVGGGVVFSHSSIELRQALDFSEQLAPAPAPAGTRFAQLGIAPGTEFGRAQIEGDGTGWGFHVGVHAQLTPAVSVGARYLSQVNIDYEGEATFTPSPLASQYVFPLGNAFDPQRTFTLADLVAPQFQTGGALAPGQAVRSRIDHPAQFQVGIGFTGLPRTTLSADYALVRWTSFDELPVDFGASSPLSTRLVEEYEDSHSARVGLEHRFGDGALGGLLSGVAGRLGFSYATTPAPDQTVTALLPDMDRYDFSVGAGIPLGSRLTLDAAYLRVETEGRRGRTVERPEGATPAQTVQLNNGWYALNANVFSISLKARF